MRQKVKHLIKHPLILGSGVLVAGSIFANFFNFLFNVFMSRNLSVADYGILASIVALITFPSLAIGAITPMIINFAGQYFANGRLDMVRGLYTHLIKLIVLIDICMCIALFIFTPQLSQFFYIQDKNLLFITIGIIFFAFISFINITLLQAKLAFLSQSFVNIFGAFVKFVLGALFVLVGFGVGGAVWSLFIATLSTYIVSFLPLRFLFNKKIGAPVLSAKELSSYGIPSALTLVGLTSFISTDIMLVKHFFPPTLAGVYAGMSLVGRVIFYLSAPIASVMFPVIVQKYSRNENFTNTFKLSLLLVGITSLAFTTFYYLFPKFTILFFLKKPEYLSVSPILWLFGVFISLFCLLTILTNFYLSIKKTFVFIPILGGAILQIILICFYHQAFIQIIAISIIITFLLVVGLLLYYPYATKRQAQN